MKENIEFLRDLMINDQEKNPTSLNLNVMFVGTLIQMIEYQEDYNNKPHPDCHPHSLNALVSIVRSGYVDNKLDSKTFYDVCNHPKHKIRNQMIAFGIDYPEWGKD